MNSKINKKLFCEIEKYIKDRYIGEYLFSDSEIIICNLNSEDKCLQIDDDSEICEMPDFLKNRRKISEYDLEQQLEKSFSEELLFIRRIVKLSATVYHKISRRVF